MSSNKSFGTRAWRKRMSLTRAQAAERLGLSVYTIKSYEIGQRQVPTPTRKLMARLEGERGEASAGQKVACVVGGGGAMSSGTPGLDFVARPSDDIVRLSSALLSAHELAFRTQLTQTMDPYSTTKSDGDLVLLAETLAHDPDLTTLVWGAWTAGEARKSNLNAATSIDVALSKRQSEQKLLRVGTLMLSHDDGTPVEALIKEGRRLAQVSKANAVVVHDGLQAILWRPDTQTHRINTDLELILACGLAVTLGIEIDSHQDVATTGRLENKKIREADMMNEKNSLEVRSF